MGIDPQFGDGAHGFDAGFAFDAECRVHHVLAQQQIGKVDFAQLMSAPLPGDDAVPLPRGQSRSPQGRTKR